MNRIIKNRFTMTGGNGNAREDDGSLQQRRRVRISRQLAIALGIIVSAVAIVLVTIAFYRKPELFSSRKRTDLEKGIDTSIFTNNEKHQLPEETSENIHLKRGKESFYKGYYTDAIAEFNEVVESDAPDKEKAVALTYIGTIEDIRGNYSKALQYYKRALTYDDRNPRIYRSIAITYKHTGQLQEALAYTEKALDFDTSNVDNLLLKGNIFYQQKKYSDALEIYARIIEIDPGNASALYNSAQTYVQKGDMLTAQDFLKRAAAADKGGRISYLSYSKLGALLIQDKDYYEAEKYLNRAIALQADDAIDHYNLGLALLHQEKPEQALQEFAKAEQLGNEDSVLLESLAAAYTDLREYDRSLTIYEKLLTINKRNVRVLALIGEIYEKKGNIKEALSAYQRITELQPATEHARVAYLAMGNILDDLQRYEEAVDAYNKAITISPKDDAAYYNLGITYKHAGKHEKAITAWQKAMQLNPDNPKPEMALADLYYDSGYFDDAMLEYKKVIEKWPTNAEAQFSLATLYHKKNLQDYAAKRYNRVIELNNNQELVRKAYINLGILESNDKADADTFDRAMQHIQKALLLKPGDADALFSLAIVYYKKGSYDQAIETFYQVLKASNDNELNARAYNNIGKAHYRKKEYKQALRAFTLGIEEDPTNEEIRINRKAAMESYEEMLTE